jgi:glycosyltransferase involved in cell wall biosynthesis
MSKPVLTIILSTHYSLDGAELCGYINRWKVLFQEYQKTYDVVVYSSDCKEYFLELGIKHNPLGIKRKIFFLWHLTYFVWLLFQSFKMKGVIKVFGSNIPTLPIVKLISKRPLIVTYEWQYAETVLVNETNLVRKILSKPMEKLALNSTDLVIVTTKSLQKIIEAKYKKPVLLLPNWVDLRNFYLYTSLKPKEKNILFAGRLVSSKGVEILLRAFSQLRNRYKETKLIICGMGPDENNFKKVAVQIGEERIEFKGVLPNEDLLKLMKETLIFVLPTLTTEGHPRVLIEAMGSGMACIATNVAGNNDVIVNEETGLLIPKNDVGSLQNAIERLLINTDLCHELGQNAMIGAKQFDLITILNQEYQALRGLYASNFK